METFPNDITYKSMRKTDPTDFNEDKNKKPDDVTRANPAENKISDDFYTILEIITEIFKTNGLNFNEDDKNLSMYLYKLGLRDPTRYIICIDVLNSIGELSLVSLDHKSRLELEAKISKMESNGLEITPDLSRDCTKSLFNIRKRRGTDNVNPITELEDGIKETKQDRIETEIKELSMKSTNQKKPIKKRLSRHDYKSILPYINQNDLIDFSKVSNRCRRSVSDMRYNTVDIENPDVIFTNMEIQNFYDHVPLKHELLPNVIKYVIYEPIYYNEYVENFYGYSDEQLQKMVFKSIVYTGDEIDYFEMKVDSNCELYDLHDDDPYLIKDKGDFVHYKRKYNPLNETSKNKIKDLVIKSGHRLNIPDPCTDIFDYCFSGQVQLFFVVLPNTLRSIGNNVFQDSGLREVIIPEGVTSIKDHAFYQCRMLTKVVLPVSLQTIGSYSFCRCNLITVTIPNNVFRLEQYAFFNGIRDINISMISIPCLTKSLVSMTSITQIIIPDSIIEIKDSCFESCAMLKHIRFGRNVKIIGERCFYGCIALNEIDLPNSINVLKNKCFCNCHLTKITIGRGLNTIGSDVFDGNHITEINYPIQLFKFLLENGIFEYQNPR